MIDYYFKKTIKENRPSGGGRCRPTAPARGRMTTTVRKQLRNFFISNLAVAVAVAAAASHMHDGTEWRGVAWHGEACVFSGRLWTSGVRFYDVGRGREKKKEKRVSFSTEEDIGGCIKPCPFSLYLSIHHPHGNAAFAFSQRLRRPFRAR